MALAKRKKYPQNSGGYTSPKYFGKCFYGGQERMPLVRTNGKVTGEGNEKKEEIEGQMDKETPMLIKQR